MKTIIINYDFVSGKELSYAEGHKSSKDFETNCLQFFSKKEFNVTILKSNGCYINNQEIYSNQYNYIQKDIRHAHNILKMFIAGAFIWQYPIATKIQGD